MAALGVLGQVGYSQTLTTHETDKAYLLAFKASITSDGGLLGDWINATDPCQNSWLGVSCRCASHRHTASQAVHTLLLWVAHILKKFIKGCTLDAMAVGYCHASRHESGFVQVCLLPPHPTRHVKL